MRKLEKNIEGEYPDGYFIIVASPRSGHNFIKENVFAWTDDTDKNKRRYCNLEGKTPRFSKTYLSEVNLDIYPNSIKILVLRSLLNWIISRMYFSRSRMKKIEEEKKFWLNNKEPLVFHKSEFKEIYDKNPRVIIIPDDMSKKDFIKRWKESYDAKSILSISLTNWLGMAKEFIGETSYLDGFIKVYYDDFFISQDYRKNICQQINGIYNENVLNIVTPEGGYSSIDRDSFQNNAQNMKVLERWKEWKNEDKEYTKIIKNHEALSFYLNNFNVSEEEKKFIDSI